MCLCAFLFFSYFPYFVEIENIGLKFALINAKPLQPAICLISTGFVIYYGSRILISLNNSRQFRDNCTHTQSDKKNELLSTLVVLNIFAKSLKLALRVVEIVLLVISAMYIESCTDNEILIGFADVQECYKTWINIIDMGLHYHLAHFSLLEFFWILFKMLNRPS